MEKQFADKNMDVTRFVAIDGAKVYGKRSHAGSKACRDTHLKLWRQIKSDEIYIIFEDDVTICDNKFSEYVKELSTVDPNWVILNFKNEQRKFKGKRVSDRFGKASKVNIWKGGRGVNAGFWAYAVNGKNIKSLLDVYKGKNLLWAIDYQLRGNFDKVNGYFCLETKHLVLHGGRKGINTQVRKTIDRNPSVLRKAKRKAKRKK